MDLPAPLGPRNSPNSPGRDSQRSLWRAHAFRSHMSSRHCRSPALRPFPSAPAPWLRCRCDGRPAMSTQQPTPANQCASAARLRHAHGPTRPSARAARKYSMIHRWPGRSPRRRTRHRRAADWSPIHIDRGLLHPHGNRIDQAGLRHQGMPKRTALSKPKIVPTRPRAGASHSRARR